jgi:hypothetical protein
MGVSVKLSESIPLIGFYFLVFFFGIPIPVEMGRVPVQAGISSLRLIRESLFIEIRIPVRAIFKVKISFFNPVSTEKLIFKDAHKVEMA